jgi:hypothetical protein
MRLLIVNLELNYSEPLTDEERREVGGRVEKVLALARKRGALHSESMRERGQRLESLHVHPRLFSPPEDGHTAALQGFWLRENPYPKGTQEYETWRLRWRQRLF